MGAELEGSRHLALQALTHVTRITVGKSPCDEIGAYGSLWVANAQSSTLTRIDPRTNKRIGAVKVGYAPCGVVPGAGALWVDGYGTNTVERVDPTTMRRVKIIPAGPAVWDVAFDGRHVWADDNGDGTVVEIDPHTNRIVRRVRTGGSPTGIAFAFGSVWVGSNGFADRTFFRVSATTGKVTRIAPGCRRPAYFAVGATSPDVWVTCVGDESAKGTVLRLDPRTNRVQARIVVGVNPGDGTVDGKGRVWIPNKNDGTVSRIDPAANAVVETVRVGGTPFVANAAFGDVWVPDAAGDTVARLHVG